MLWQQPKLLVLYVWLQYLGSILGKYRVKSKNLWDGHSASSVACIGRARCRRVVKCDLLFPGVHLQKRHGFRCVVDSLRGANPHHHFHLQGVKKEWSLTPSANHPQLSFILCCWRISQVHTGIVTHAPSTGASAGLHVWMSHQRYNTALVSLQLQCFHTLIEKSCTRTVIQRKGITIPKYVWTNPPSC